MFKEAISVNQKRKFQHTNIMAKLIIRDNLLFVFLFPATHDVFPNIILSISFLFKNFDIVLKLFYAFLIVYAIDVVEMQFVSTLYFSSDCISGL